MRKYNDIMSVHNLVSMSQAFPELPRHVQKCQISAIPCQFSYLALLAAVTACREFLKITNFLEDVNQLAELKNMICLRFTRSTSVVIVLVKMSLLQT